MPRALSVLRQERRCAVQSLESGSLGVFIEIKSLPNIDLKEAAVGKKAATTSLS